MTSEQRAKLLRAGTKLSFHKFYCLRAPMTDEPTEREIMDRHATFLLRAFLWGLALALVVIALMQVEW